VNDQRIKVQIMHALRRTNDVGREADETNREYQAVNGLFGHGEWANVDKMNSPHQVLPCVASPASGDINFMAKAREFLSHAEDLLLNRSHLHFRTVVSPGLA